MTPFILAPNSISGARDADSSHARPDAAVALPPEAVVRGVRDDGFGAALGGALPADEQEPARSAATQPQNRK